MTNRWPSRIAAFTLWALAAISATFWLLKVTGVSEGSIKAGAISAETPSVNAQDLARALGPAVTPGAANADVPAQASDASARLRLLGVVAGRSSGGIALIAIEGQAPRPYRVGSQIDASHTLTQVATRTATLSPLQPDGKSFTLELPTPTGAAPPLPFGGAGARRPSGLAPSMPAAAMLTKPSVAPVVAPPANAPAITPAPDAE